LAYFVKDPALMKTNSTDIPGPPSSLDLDRVSPARSSQQLDKGLDRVADASADIVTGGDVDADAIDAATVGDEAPGGDNPTPDQDVVDEIGRALGVEYQDNQPLQGGAELEERDRHRWELDPASAEDFKERARDK
jgi:hypothetical protein